MKWTGEDVAEVLARIQAHQSAFLRFTRWRLLLLLRTRIDASGPRRYAALLGRRGAS